MRVAVLSDIHGNLLALEAVLADLAAQGGADAVVIAGDLCLQGPRPREVLERLQELSYPVVEGNADRFVSQPASLGADADASLVALVEWTREQVGPVGLDYLAGLPFSHQITDPAGTALLVVHANPRDLDTHLRPLAPEEAILPLLVALPAEVTTLAFGHLHIPYTRRVGGILLADIASVGLPKDGDRRANYGLFTWQGAGWAVEQRRVEYAVDEVVAQLRAADPPGAQQLIRQLLRARYPNMAEARGGRQASRRVIASAPAVVEPIPAAPEPIAPAPATPRPARTRAAAKPIAARKPPVAPPPPVEATAEEATVADAVVDAVVAEIAVPEPPALTIEAVAPIAPVVEIVEAEASPPAPKKPAKGGAKKKEKRSAKVAPQITFAAADSFPAILPALLGERLDAVLAPMAIVREDEDPEGVHEMRVAIRRLRGALEPAAPYYGKDFKRVVRRVKTLARALGRVRDADVHLITLRKRLARAAPDERAGISGLIDGILTNRAYARADLDPFLDQWDGHSAEHAAEMRLFIMRAKPRKLKDRSRDSFAAVATQALTARLEALSAIAVFLTTPGPGDAEAFHKVRIVAKQLRYTLEIFSPVLGPDIADLLAELKTLQDLLGELHDRDVLIDLLHDERTAAAERELLALDHAAFEEGPRSERLDSVRAHLADANGFAATAVGIYGLLIDVIDERSALVEQSRTRWEELAAVGFLDRLWGLTDVLQPPTADAADATDVPVEAVASA